MSGSFCTQYFRPTWLVKVSFHYWWLSFWGSKGKSNLFFSLRSMIVLLFFQVVGCSGTVAVARQNSTQNGQDSRDAGYPALPSWELARALTCWVIQYTRSFFFIELIWFAVGFQHNSKAFLGDICVFSSTVVWKTVFFCFLFHLIEFFFFLAYFPCLIFMGKNCKQLSE